MPWCMLKGTFYLAHGNKDAGTMADGTTNPLTDFGISATGKGTGVVLILDIDRGYADDSSSNDVRLDGSRVAIVGTLPQSGTASGTLYTPLSGLVTKDFSAKAGAMQLLMENNGHNGGGSGFPYLGLLEALSGLNLSSSSVSTSVDIKITEDPVTHGDKVEITGVGNRIF